MIKYITDNRILSLGVIMNTLTAYLLFGVIDDIIVPTCECYLYKFEHKINYHRFSTKLMIWLLFLLYCIGINYSIT